MIGATEVVGYQRRGLRVGPIGFPWRPRSATVAGVVSAVIAALFLASVLTGTTQVTIERFLAVLGGYGTATDNLVVWELRLPRALLAIVTGFALGAAGAITQSITRNPLASPDILGISIGASLGAVGLIVVGTRSGLAGSLAVSAAALVGGLVVAGIVVFLSWRGGVNGLRLILAGIGISAVGDAVISWMLIVAELDLATVATRWLTGSLGSASWSDLAVTAPVTVILALVVVTSSRILGTLRMDDATGHILGLRVSRAQLGQVLVAVVLVSVATAAVGPIGFVAFVAPQLAMRLTGSAGPPPLTGGLVGSALVLSADFATRFLPGGITVGIVTSLVGAPFFLVLLLRYLRRTSA